MVDEFLVMTRINDNAICNALAKIVHDKHCNDFLFYKQFFFRMKVGYGNLKYFASNDKKTCLAASWNWGGETTHMAIDIPSTIDNSKVISLGGAVGRGAPFVFDITYSSFAITDHGIRSLDRVIGAYSLVELDFTLNLGENVSFIDSELDTFQQYYDEAGNQVIIKAYMYVNCDPENKTFYSKDGKLYYRENDELVDCFFYR